MSEIGMAPDGRNRGGPGGGGSAAEAAASRRGRRWPSGGGGEGAGDGPVKEDQTPPGKRQANRQAGRRDKDLRHGTRGRRRLIQPPQSKRQRP